MFGFGYAWLANEIGDTIALTKLFKMRPVDYAIQNLDEKVIVQTKHCIIENLKHVQMWKGMYVNIDLPYMYERALSNFRCSRNSLNIQTDRHRNIDN